MIPSPPPFCLLMLQYTFLRLVCALRFSGSALGDMVAKTAGVISTPFRVSRHVKPNQKVLVIASDGLWDFVPNEEAILIATQANDSRTAAVSTFLWAALWSE